jgi:hypothetical protein
MSGNLQKKHVHLYNETQVSLQQYHQSIVNLLEAVRKRTTKDYRLLSNMQMTASQINDSLLNIHTIQQKKILMQPDAEPLRNMVSYRIHFYYGLPKILIEDDIPHPPWKPF